jgi:hypothetical protein
MRRSGHSSVGPSLFSVRSDLSSVGSGLLACGVPSGPASARRAVGPSLSAREAPSASARRVAGPNLPACESPSGPASARRSPAAHLSLLALALLPSMLLGQSVTREGNRWFMTVTGKVPTAPRLQVNAQGPVRLEGGSGNEISYTAKLGIDARSEEEARRILSRYSMRMVSSGEQVMLAAPGGPIVANLTIKAPRVTFAIVRTAGGSVDANSLDGDLQVNSGGGDIRCDRIRGDLNLTTAGGNIQIGEAGGALRCGTAGGKISVRDVKGEAVLETAGGDVEVNNAGSDLRVTTAGGSIRVNTAAGSVTAGTSGGSITIGKAGGVVTIREVAGPVQVGAAAGVRCESASGAVRVSNIAGPMRVTTAVGSIVASLLASSLFRDSLLETGNGDVTVLIPSNLGVTIRAQTDRGRVVSDFPGLALRTVGMQMQAEGPLNGGGPMLRISGTGGTIFIRRQ